MYITLTELNYIVAVAKEKHFGKAANICFVSQPTLSIAIKKLETNLGIQIFERNKTHVLITKPGEIIIAKAKLILDMSSEIENFAKISQDQYLEPIKLGAIHTTGPYLYPELMGLISEKLPQLKLNIEEDFTSNLETKLLNNELDAIIVAKPFSKSGISTIELYQEALKVITSKEHPFKKKKNIDPNILNDEIILLLGNGHCFRDQVLEICPACNISSKTGGHIIITSSLETIKQMVAYNQGISIVPQSSIINSTSELLTIHSFRNPIPQRSIVLAYRSGFSRIEVLLKLAKLIQIVSKNFS